MRVLLDTSAFVRWMAGTPLPKDASRVLNRQDAELLISIVTAWEIVMKPALQRSSADVEQAVSDMGAQLLQISFPHLEELSRLPLNSNHRDPFDRMLIAQAIAEDIPIISSDSRFEEYKKVRVIWD